MMEPEGGSWNSVTKRRNAMEFGLVWFVLTSTLKKYLKFTCYTLSYKRI